MNAAAVNIADFRKRRSRGLGDDVSDVYGNNSFVMEGGGGGVPTIDVPLPDSIPEISLPPQDGTVSVQDLAAQNQAGAFNNLQTPFPYFGDVYSSGNPYAAETETIPGVNGGEPFTVYTPQAPNVGGGGLLNRPISSVAGGATSTTAAAATSSSGVLASIETFMGTPLYSGAPITWGWALAIAAVAWLLLRRR